MTLAVDVQEHLELLLPVRVLGHVEEPSLRGDAEVAETGGGGVRGALLALGPRRRAPVEEVEDGGVNGAGGGVHRRVQVAVGEENLAHRREHGREHRRANLVHAQTQKPPRVRRHAGPSARETAALALAPVAVAGSAAASERRPRPGVPSPVAPPRVRSVRDGGLGFRRPRRETPMRGPGVVIDVEGSTGDGIVSALPTGRKRGGRRGRGGASVSSSVRRGGRRVRSSRGRSGLPARPRPDVRVRRRDVETEDATLFGEHLNGGEITGEVGPVETVGAVVPEHASLPLRGDLLARVPRAGVVRGGAAHAARHASLDEVRSERVPQTFHRLGLPERLDVPVPVEVQDGDGGEPGAPPHAANSLVEVLGEQKLGFPRRASKQVDARHGEPLRRARVPGTITPRQPTEIFPRPLIRVLLGDVNLSLADALFDLLSPPNRHGPATPHVTAPPHGTAVGTRGSAGRGRTVPVPRGGGGDGGGGCGSRAGFAAGVGLHPHPRLRRVRLHRLRRVLATLAPHELLHLHFVSGGGARVESSREISRARVHGRSSPEDGEAPLDAPRVPESPRLGEALEQRRARAGDAERAEWRGEGVVPHPLLVGVRESILARAREGARDVVRLAVKVEVFHRDLGEGLHRGALLAGEGGCGVAEVGADPSRVDDGEYLVAVGEDHRGANFAREEDEGDVAEGGASQDRAPALGVLPQAARVEVREGGVLAGEDVQAGDAAVFQRAGGAAHPARETTGDDGIEGETVSRGDAGGRETEGSDVRAGDRGRGEKRSRDGRGERTARRAYLCSARGSARGGAPPGRIPPRRRCCGAASRGPSPRRATPAPRRPVKWSARDNTRGARCYHLL